MGTLGFLLPFRLCPLHPVYLLSPHQLNLDIDDFAKALESVFLGKATILNRMRLACIFYDEKLSKKGSDGDGLYGDPPFLDTPPLSIAQIGKS
jgi:NADH kinase